jgi:hypothetical protein
MVRVAIMAAAFALVGATDAPQLTALAGIEPGMWTLREPGVVTTTPPRTMCLTDPRALLQIQHPTATCARFVIANDPRETTVHYTCPGAGHGRTTVRVESPRIIHIDSQGIANKAPFDWSLEGRRTGACPVAPATPTPTAMTRR